MNTAEIIMQQKRIAAEKEKAEKKLAYDVIKVWTENNVNTLANEILCNLAKKFANGDCDKVVYSCWSGLCNYPLGKDYPENIGCGWELKCYKNHILKKEFSIVLYEDRFFSSNAIEKKEYSVNYLNAFVSQLLFHTALPELLRNEGFVVGHTGCGCCERIEVTLPEL